MALSWARFLELEGDPKNNFELLMRAVVQRNYGRAGQMRSVRQQPGVEFHLKLHQDCDLGTSGRWFGWQCRWLQLRADNTFTSSQRRSIEDAIAKTKKYLPGVTDFVLCLRQLPASSDESWFHQLDDDLRLHLWAEEEIESRLTGSAAVLRETYFGELVLTAEDLATAHERSVGPVRQRWVPELDVRTEASLQVEAALLRPGSAAHLADQSQRLLHTAAALVEGTENDAKFATEGPREALKAELSHLGAHLAAIVAAIDADRPSEARELIERDAAPAMSPRTIDALARRLRARGVPAALPASGAKAEIRYSLRLLSELRSLLEAPLVAVVAEAGRGKSHLAAQITSATKGQLPGVFLRGADLRAGGSLDELVARVRGIGLASIDQLLAAVDAAAARSGRRVPIVIDGLNEAERPTDWRTELSAVTPILSQFPHVLIVVTVRDASCDEVLVPEAKRIELEWHSQEVAEAVRRYFEFYLIDPGSARLPMNQFADPLFLRMFCEAVNGDRQHPVGVEKVPGDLVAVYELYRDRAVGRIAEHLQLRPLYVQNQLAHLAVALWDQRARDLPFEEMQAIIDEPARAWNDSLVRAFEQEGILFRNGEEGWQDQRGAVLFDRFAGYLIADAITRDLGIDAAREFLASHELWEQLRPGRGEGAISRRVHPLSTDIWLALVGLVPRRFHRENLWRLAPSEHRETTLAQVVELESDLLDTDTLDALHQLLVTRSGPPRGRNPHVLDRLWDVRDGTAHRLNATFLDGVLQAMPVAQRDLVWSEWIRSRREELLQDLSRESARWRAENRRDPADDLNALAIAWLQTSTILPLRDRATQAIQTFGRPDPGRVFQVAEKLLDVDDAYVSERVLAACFGAATAHQMPDPGGPFEHALAVFLEALQSRFLGDAATSPTSHRLARGYIAGLFEFASALHPAALPAGVDASALPFAAGATSDPIAEDDSRADEVDRTFGMDFENYVVGTLYENRGNYDMHHPAFVAGMAEVRGRVWQLGWRTKRFDEVDRRIRDSIANRSRQEGPDRTERYGKKYGWISYYELAGRLQDRGELRDRWLGNRGIWPDIDPTFPDLPAALESPLTPWADGGPADDATWYQAGSVSVPDSLLTPEEVDGHAGPWVIVEGWMENRNHPLGRRVWGFLRGFFVDAAQADQLVRVLETRNYLGNHFVPDSPSDHSTYAGEIPWAAEFARHGDLENDLPPYHAPVRERWDEPGVPVELLGHRYEMSASRTTTMVATGHWVPSQAIAERFDLRQRPGTLDLVALDGRAASVTRGAPSGFDGSLLYLRRDLLSRYAAGRKLILLAWGERQVDLDFHDLPQWLEDLRGEHADLWRRVRVLKL